MLVRIEELRAIFKNMIDKLEEVSPIEIELNFTTYWTTTFDDGQSLNPPKPFVSDVRDDWRNIKKELYSHKLPTQNDFELLGNLLKAVGLKLDRLKEEKRQ